MSGRRLSASEHAPVSGSIHHSKLFPGRASFKVVSHITGNFSNVRNDQKSLASRVPIGYTDFTVLLLAAMMTDMRELRALVERARKAGAQIDLTYDARARSDEGRAIISTVRVQGMAGIGPYPMPAICAAERLREALAQPI
jgi:hypothetical protein